VFLDVWGRLDSLAWDLERPGGRPIQNESSCLWTSLPNCAEQGKLS
jgi:hypothetical protein